MVESRASDQNAADFRFDSRPGNASLCLWKRHFTLISHWGHSVYSLWWASLTKEIQTEPKKVLCVSVVIQTQSAWFIRTNECKWSYLGAILAVGYCMLCSIIISFQQRHKNELLLLMLQQIKNTIGAINTVAALIARLFILRTYVTKRIRFISAR